MKVFVSLSVFLNVLLVGVLIGGGAKPHFDRGYKSAQMEQRWAEILEVLSAEKSKEFELRILDLKALKRSGNVTMKSARKNIRQVFMKEPFDRAAYQEAVLGLNKVHQQQMEARVSLMADMAHYLSPKERRLLSRLMMKHGGRK